MEVPSQTFRFVKGQIIAKEIVINYNTKHMIIKETDLKSNYSHTHGRTFESVYEIKQYLSRLFESLNYSDYEYEA